MSIVAILKQDYQRFPTSQTYSIYADDVYFQDPLTKFRGINHYKKMIWFIQQWFLNPKMDVHFIQQQENTIKTEWTLSWNTPLPWKPRIFISGSSELLISPQNVIVSHIDYWCCSPLNVLKQHLFAGKSQ
ncbi:hypothetical protein RINTHM_16490 [Richelia intracellularis HM01]|uniref:DUF2358 domain-containing protein n=1 Tax=Richelia intracellularis TaxID=1164990 RepID=UPI0002B55537|nr:DUF2358 domain-containing protein [Richelia intracellularis]CCH66103.1 hypothetical protein RINTHM_16490 [Richelia intracellularis HM01]